MIVIQTRNQLILTKKQTAMKTTKSILLTALMVFATLGFSFSDTEPPPTKTDITQDNALIRVSIQEVAHMPRIAGIVRAQISPTIFELKHKRYYSFRVLDRRQHYVVYGYYNDWKVFFKL